MLSAQNTGAGRLRRKFSPSPHHVCGKCHPLRCESQSVVPNSRHGHSCRRITSFLVCRAGRATGFEFEYNGRRRTDVCPEAFFIAPDLHLSSASDRKVSDGSINVSIDFSFPSVETQAASGLWLRKPLSPEKLTSANSARSIARSNSVGDMPYDCRKDRLNTEMLAKPHRAAIAPMR